MNELTSELDAMPQEAAERLSNILRGLFSCMQDLDNRMTAVENSKISPARSRYN